MTRKEETSRARLRQAMMEACAADCRALGEQTAMPDGFEERLTRRLWAEERRRHRRTVWVRTAAAVLVVVISGLTALTGLERFTERPEQEYTLGYVPAECTPTYRYTSSESAYTRWTDTTGTAQLVLLQNSTPADALLDFSDCKTRPVEVAGRKSMLYTKAGYAALTWTMDDYYFTLVFNGSNAAELVMTAAEHLRLK